MTIVPIGAQFWAPPKLRAGRDHRQPLCFQSLENKPQNGRPFA
jgi:hypothetical protein